MQTKVLAVFEVPTVFLVECMTPEIISALCINPELDLTILMRKDGVIYADRRKRVGSGADRISTGESWESIRSLFNGHIYAVKEDVKERNIPPEHIVSQVDLIPKRNVSRLIDRSNIVLVY